MTFSVRQAQIIGLFVETLLYGMHLISFGVCFHCLFSTSSESSSVTSSSDTNTRRARSLMSNKVKRGLLLMSLALLTIASLDVALGVVNDYNGLMSPGGQDTLNTPNWLTVSRTVLLGTQNLIGDSIWVYRCWIIYDRRYSVIAFPSILFLAVLGLSFTIAGLEPDTVPGPLPQAGTTTLMISVVYGISFVSSLLTTVLIVARLRRVDRELTRYDTDPAGTSTTGSTSTNATNATDGSQSTGAPQHIRHARVVRRRPRRQSRLGLITILIVESGLMFTTTEFFCMMAFALKSNMAYIATYMDIQIIPIAFNLIVIRLHMSRSPSSSSVSRSSPAAFDDIKSDEPWSVARPPGLDSEYGTVMSQGEAEENLGYPIASPRATHALEARAGAATGAIQSAV